jgi:small subunit ribosomal protein S7
MSRRKVLKSYKRDIKGDEKYNDVVISKFINILMEGGKKSTAAKVIYKAFEKIEKELKEDPKEVFLKAIDNIKPDVEVRPRRVGGATYQVPVEVEPGRALALAFRWLKMFSSKRNEKTYSSKLAKEIIAAYNKTGASMKKREDVFKMAESNRAFAHYKF